MKDQFVTCPHAGGERGINPALVCSWEADDKGNALVRTIDGHHIGLSADQWKVVAPALRPDSGATQGATGQAPVTQGQAPAGQ